MAQATFQLSVRVKRANCIFKEGLGVGVLGTQQVVFTLPDTYSAGLLAARVIEEGDKMVEDIIEVVIEPISVSESK